MSFFFFYDTSNFQACDNLLAFRVESKTQCKKVEGILNRLHVAYPKERDEKIRPPCIPGENLYFYTQIGEESILTVSIL